MDGDKVDLVIGGYGTNSQLPAMPLIMERQRFFVGLMGLGVNNALAYPNYFAMIPTGPDPNAALTEGFFALAAKQRPRPATVALLSADAEFSRNPILGARANTEKFGLKIVHEATYPPHPLRAIDRCRGHERLRSPLSLLLPCRPRSGSYDCRLSGTSLRCCEPFDQWSDIIILVGGEPSPASTGLPEWSAQRGVRFR
jgi:hypothetical protein